MRISVPCILIKVPQAIGSLNFVVFSAHQNINLTAGWQGLADYKVGYVAGWKIIEQHMEGFKYSYPVCNAKTLFAMLQAKRFDLVIYDEHRGLEILKKLNIMKISPKKTALSSQKMYLFVHKKHKQLISELSISIKNVTAKINTEQVVQAQ